MSAKYVVMLNQPGYLPEADPQEYETLHDAKQGLRSEINYWLDSQWAGVSFNEWKQSGDTLPKFDVWTPLKSITRQALLEDGAVTYGKFSDGYVLSIALD